MQTVFLRTLAGLGLAALAAAASAQITLFDAPRFGGRQFTTSQAVSNFSDGGFNDRAASANHQVVANLDGSGFNDRASSLRVEGGYWIFCSDANFQGECQTFAPGDYPYLAGLNNRISSGRRVSGSYPYDTSPHWSGPR